MTNPYVSVLRTPGAARFFVGGFVGRMPMSMLTIAVLLVVRDQTGSYAVAGVASAAAALTQAAVSPLLGRLADRRSQSTVLPGLLGLFLLGLTVLDVTALVDGPVVGLFVGAVLAGAGLVPFSSFVRARWASLLTGDESGTSTALALESVVDETIYVVGPILVATLAAVDPLLGPIAAAVLAVVGTLVFLAARDTEPAADAHGSGGAAWRVPGLWVVVGASFALGAVFGSLEVSMVAFSQREGAPGLSGFLLALIAFGSATAGFVYGTRTWRRSLGARLRLSFGTLAVTAVPTVLAPSVLWMVPASLVVGLSIAPTLIAANGVVARIMPPSGRTEGFSWQNGSINVGAAAGSALGGLLVDAVGVSAGFSIGPVAAAIGCVTIALGARWLVPTAAASRSRSDASSRARTSSGTFRSTLSRSISAASSPAVNRSGRIGSRIVDSGGATWPWTNPPAARAAAPGGNRPPEPGGGPARDCHPSSAARRPFSSSARQLRQCPSRR